MRLQIASEEYRQVGRVVGEAVVEILTSIAWLTTSMHRYGLCSLLPRLHPCPACDNFRSL